MFSKAGVDARLSSHTSIDEVDVKTVGIFGLFLFAKVYVKKNMTPFCARGVRQ